MEKVERYLIFFLLVRERSLTAFLDRADIRERASLTRSSRIFLNLSYLSLCLSFVRSFPFSFTKAQYYRLCRFRLYLTFKISRVRPICNSIEKKKKRKEGRMKGRRLMNLLLDFWNN